MTIKELKECIIDNTINVGLLVFLCKDSDHFLANQYIDSLCENNGLKRNSVSSLSAINNSSALSMIMMPDNELTIVRTDTFSEDYDYDTLDNTVIVCDKIDKKILKKLEPFIIEMPKLCEWQIKDYIKNICPKLSNDYIDWLYKVSNGNITRITNELDKVNLFDPTMADRIVLAMKNNKYTDLYSLSTFSFVDAIIKNDRLLIAEALAHTKCWDSDPMFILTLLINKYKQIILIHGNSGLSAEDIGLSPKQFNAIKYYYKGYNIDELRDKLEFLSKINLRINLGEFDCGNSSTFLDYLVCNLI